jgi:hypothetical protein
VESLIQALLHSKASDAVRHKHLFGHLLGFLLALQVLYNRQRPWKRGERASACDDSPVVGDNDGRVLVVGHRGDERVRRVARCANPVEEPVSGEDDGRRRADTAEGTACGSVGLELEDEGRVRPERLSTRAARDVDTGEILWFR